MVGSLLRNLTNFNYFILAQNDEVFKIYQCHSMMTEVTELERFRICVEKLRKLR